MYPLIFSVVMMVASWTAWRRNPIYAARSTRRAAVIVLLSVSAVIGLIVATVKLTINSSAEDTATALALAIALGTLVLVFFIQAATVPRASKPAALPYSFKLITNNRARIYKWLRLFAVLIAIFVLGSLIPGPARYISLILGGLTLFLTVILLPIFYFTNPAFQQSRIAVELNPWVHWHYPPELWQLWSAIQAERLRCTPPSFLLQRDWRRFLFPFAVIVAGVVIFAPGSWLFRAIYLLLIGGLMLGIAILTGGGDARHADILHEHLLNASPEAYFGRDGVFCDGVLTPWLTVGTRLVSATIDQRQPRSLLLNFVRSVPDPYGPSQVVPIHQAVLIPAGAEGDLARLQQELTARCPKAKITLA